MPREHGYLVRRRKPRSEFGRLLRQGLAARSPGSEIGSKPFLPSNLPRLKPAVCGEADDRLAIDVNRVNPGRIAHDRYNAKAGQSAPEVANFLKQVGRIWAKREPPASACSNSLSADLPRSAQRPVTDAAGRDAVADRRGGSATVPAVMGQNGGAWWHKLTPQKLSDP